MTFIRRLSPRVLSPRLLSIGLLGAVSIGTFVWSSSRSAHANPATLSPANDALGGAMKQMNESLKALGKGVTAETSKTALDELAKFENAVITAKAQTPDSAAKIDEKKRAAFVADYRKSLVDALKLACDAEVAIVDGKYKDADTLIRNKLSALKSAGHSKFKTEDGK